MNNALSPQDLKDEGLRLFQQGNHGQALSTFEQAAAAFAAQDDSGSHAEMLKTWA